MFNQKLCLGLSDTFGAPPERLIEIIRDAGFEEIFIDASDRNVDYAHIANFARQTGLEVQSLHAPFNRSDDMWDEDGDLGEIAMNELISFAEGCSNSEIPIMVTHAFIGFDNDRKPTDAGIERYGKVAGRCGELGIKLGLENTEGLEFLDTLLKEFRGNKAVGFCWDSGHELCYNYSKNLLAEYGDLLICTHLNDNLGISRYDGKIFWTDDLHLLPFDGIRDWKETAERLNKCGFDGPLTFELTRKSKPSRHENDGYAAMSTEEYIAEVYKRACRVAALR